MISDEAYANRLYAELNARNARIAELTRENELLRFDLKLAQQQGADETEVLLRTRGEASLRHCRSLPREDRSFACRSHPPGQPAETGE